MNEKRRLEGFQASLASDKSGSYLLEDADGDRRPWPELSAQGKVAFIARAAAMYDVPFERFAAAVRAEVGEAAMAEAGLRNTLALKRELHGLAKLVPDDGRTESTPLVERFQEILEYTLPQRAGLMAYETAEGVKTHLESFQYEFERLARTREQKKLVEAFKEFVGEVTSASWKETFDKLLRQHEEPKPSTKQAFQGILEDKSPPQAESSADKWQYDIKPYRRIPGEFGWIPAKEAEATVWFGFRERGDDHRCFGVFPTRGDAERAMGMLKEQEKVSEADKFNRMLDEKASGQMQGKQQDKGIER